MQRRMLQTIAGRDQGFLPNTPVMNQNHNEQWASRSWHTRQGGCSSEYLAVLLLAWGRKNPEGRLTSNSAPWTQYTQVLGNSQSCSTLHTIAITSGNHCGLVVKDRWNPDFFFFKVKNTFNDEQELGGENAFKSVCSCYSICVIHRLMLELQKTARVSDLHCISYTCTVWIFS